MLRISYTTTPFSLSYQMKTTSYLTTNDNHASTVHGPPPLHMTTVHDCAPPHLSLTSTVHSPHRLCTTSILLAHAGQHAFKPYAFLALTICLPAICLMLYMLIPHASLVYIVY